jgi:hypothetical protein
MTWKTRCACTRTDLSLSVARGGRRLL